jgi:hypothetical protein
VPANAHEQGTMMIPNPIDGSMIRPIGVEGAPCRFSNIWVY